MTLCGPKSSVLPYWTQQKELCRASSGQTLLASLLKATITVRRSVSISCAGALPESAQLQTTGQS